MSVLGDIKEWKAWVLGAIAFDAAVTSLLVTIFEVDMVKTTIATTATTLVALAIIVLIYRSEARSRQSLQDYMKKTDTSTQKIQDSITEIRGMILDNGKSTLRLEINEEILRNPHNHDTILKMGEKYFCEMDGDWYMTNRFLDWADQEQVHLPPSLMGLKRD